MGLSERIDAWENNIEGIDYYKQQNDLPKYKKLNPEYGVVYSKVLQHALRILDASYKSFFGLWKKGYEDVNPPKFRGRKYFFTMTYNQSGFKINENEVTLSHKVNDTELKFVVPNKFSFDRIYQVSVFMKDNNYYLSVTYEKNERKYVDNHIYQAFDLGVTKHVAVNTKGKFTEIINQRPDKYWKPKVESIQSRIDHCRKNSNKQKKLIKNFKRMKRKSSNQLKDFQHKLSRKLVYNTKANTIIVGDLGVKDICKINKHQKGLHASLHNTGCISRFVNFLTYKAKLVGKKVVKISERDTTKKCCVCGMKQEMPLYKRIYECDCGNVIDRDRNSSINIMTKYLSQNALWTSLSDFQMNLRQTGLLIGGYSQEAITLNH